MKLKQVLTYFHTDERRVDPEGRPFRLLRGMIKGREIEIKEMNGFYHAMLDNNEKTIKMNMDEGGLVGWIFSLLNK